MKKISAKILFIIPAIGFLIFVWLRGGMDKVYLDSDIARDLSEISKLWIGQKVIWLGPRFSMGLHSNPLYYYLFFIPIYLSQGNASSLIIFNVILATSSLVFLGSLSIKKYGNKGILIPLVIGLMPWWRNIAIHPGNGFTYSIFLLISLTSVWFKLPLFISSFFLGLSASFHPGAFFGLPLLIYEIVKNKAPLKITAINTLVFLVPFLPVIAFEIVTKGYWLKEWLVQPRLGFQIIVNSKNITNFFSYSGINLYLGLLSLALLIISIKKREKVWMVLSSMNVLFFLFIAEVPMHYLFGILTILWFSVVFALMRKKAGSILIIFLGVYFLIGTIIIQPAPGASARSISRIENTVRHLIKSGIIEKEDNLAVLSLKSANTKTPQADDYRFFLRVKGYTVEEVTDYALADKLIIFVEDDSLDWENWNTWETDQFGKKVLSDKIEINDIIMAVYKKVYED